VASTTLLALVPAWLAAGRGSEELWGSLLAALPGLPAHRRLGLLESLLAALPEVSLWACWIFCGVLWFGVCECCLEAEIGGDGDFVRSCGCGVVWCGVA
jgi:hypothetical protein